MSADPSFTVLFIQSEGPGHLDLRLNGLPLAYKRYVSPTATWLDMTDLHNVAAGNVVSIYWRGEGEIASGLKCRARHFPVPRTISPEQGSALQINSDSGLYDPETAEVRFAPVGPTFAAEFAFQAPGHDFYDVYFGAEFIAEEDAIRNAYRLYDWFQAGETNRILSAFGGRLADLARINAVAIEEVAAPLKQAIEAIVEDFKLSPRNRTEIGTEAFCDGRLHEVQIAGRPLMERLILDDDGGTFEIPIFIGKRNGKITILR